MREADSELQVTLSIVSRSGLLLEDARGTYQAGAERAGAQAGGFSLF